jgi:hypothetical protein
LNKLRDKTEGNHRALLAQVAELAAELAQAKGLVEELAQARAEIARLRAITIAHGLEPSTRVH